MSTKQFFQSLFVTINKIKLILMKKFTITSILLIALIFNISAQDDGFYAPDKPEDTKSAKKEIRQKKLERWSFGGSFWLSFGSNQAYIDISPLALYRATPRLRVGGGFTYQYNKFPNTYITDTSKVLQTIKTHTFGPKLYSDFILFNGSKNSSFNIGTIMAAVEYSYLMTDELKVYTRTNEIVSTGRVPVNLLLIGGGIYQPFGERGGLSFMVLFDVINNVYSPYSNPVIRLGFYF